MDDGGIGPREKENSPAYLNSGLGDERLESLVKAHSAPAMAEIAIYTLAGSQARNNLAHFQSRS
jgi:hypothetical protein